MTWIAKSGMQLAPRRTDRTSYTATFDDGSSLPTMPGAQVNYLIANSEFAGDVEINVGGGEIIGIRTVKPQPAGSVQGRDPAH